MTPAPAGTDPGTGTPAAPPPAPGPGAPPAPPAPPPPPGRFAAAVFLEGPAAEVLSLVLFATAGVWLAEALFLAPPSMRLGASALVTLLGPLGCGIERGRARPPGAALAAGLATIAASAHLLALTWTWGALPAASDAAARLLLLVPAGALLARLGTRLDRDEAAWRAGVRLGPPAGSTPLAARLARLRLPRPLSRVLLPLSLVGRAAALLAILLYQLTFSRLMPPACRFEPTCSRYGFEAFFRHGVCLGCALTGLRLLRCSPLSDGGYDPVPRGGPA